MFRSTLLFETSKIKYVYYIFTRNYDIKNANPI